MAIAQAYVANFIDRAVQMMADNAGIVSTTGERDRKWDQNATIEIFDSVRK